MDFYTHQDNARRRSRSLLWRFMLANLLLLGILAVALSLFAELAVRFNESGHKGFDTSTDFTVFTNVLPFALQLDVFVFGVIIISAGIRFWFLSARGGSVAEALGGSRVPPDTDDPLERRYLNVVEEMAIAANVPVPDVYVLQNEEGINAFASGPSPERSAVAVTRGALERLSRDELQGVVAHEFSHITHGDVRLNIRLASYIYGLMVLYVIGRFFLEIALRSNNNRSSRRDSKDGSGLLFLGILALIFFAFGFLGRLVSVFMSAAISRQREFLADATAVQLTRNPDGIADALKKIGGYSKGSVIRNSQAAGMSHFFLARSDASKFFDRLYATHPPLEERIKRLEPDFDGALPDSDSIEIQSAHEDVSVSMLHGAVERAGERFPAEMPEFRHADWMPPKALHKTFIGVGSAESAVCAILLSKEGKARAKQESIVSAFTSLSDVQLKSKLYESLPLSMQLSIVMMAMPSVQGEARSYRAAFRRTVSQMVRADGEVTLLEFLIGTLVHFATGDRDLSFTLRGSPTHKGLESVAKNLEVVLSVCASFATTDTSEAQSLVGNASKELGVPCAYKPAARDDIPFFILSIEKLQSVEPLARHDLMRVFDAMVRRDGVVTEIECALMRTFSMLFRAELPDLPEYKPDYLWKQARGI